MAGDQTAIPSLVKAFREQYELIRETGRGGSATVYLARDLKHDRFVAIKVLHSDVGGTSGERFLREIRVSAGMQSWDVRTAGRCRRAFSLHVCSNDEPRPQLKL